MTQSLERIEAAVEAARRFPLAKHPSLVLCQVRSEGALLRALADLAGAGIACALFREPDLNHQATALATEPLQLNARAPMRRFPLWKGAAS